MNFISVSEKSFLEDNEQFKLVASGDLLIC